MTLISVEQAAEARRVAFTEMHKLAEGQPDGSRREPQRMFPIWERNAPADLARAPIFGGKNSPGVVSMRAKLEEHPTKNMEMYHLHGFASVYETWYTMWDFFGPYDEKVAKDAGETSLAADPDVVYLENHRGLAMARTANDTLYLNDGTREEDGKLGLEMDAWLNPKRSDVKNHVIAVDDGTMTEMSFAFMILDGRWNDDYTNFTIAEYDINRGDVSGVNYGANPYTSIAARTPALIAELRHLPSAAARAAVDQLAARGDVVPKPFREFFDAPTMAELRSRIEAATLAERGVTPEVVAATLAPSGTPSTRGGRSITELEAVLNEL